MKSISQVLIIISALSVLSGYSHHESESINTGSNLSVETEKLYRASDLEPVSDAKTAETNSVLSVIFSYQKLNSKLFFRVMPTDEAYYYERNIAEQILNHAFYNEKQISFYWNNQPIGYDKGERYELIECFVNPSGTELIIFAIKDGQKIVFHNNPRPKSSKDIFNLLLSQDETLNRFTEETTDNQPIQSVKPGRYNSLISAIFNYQKAKGEMFLMAAATDEDNFYGWNVPGQALSQAFYKGKQISFRWYDYTMGEGEEYQLIDCFVNPKGTDLIVFAMKDGQRIVFHNTTSPEDDALNLELSTDAALNQFTAESTFD